MVEPRWPIGTFPWRELVADDVAGARRFYGALFGWTWASEGEGPARVHWIASRDGEAVASLARRERGAPLPPCWRSFVAVAEVDGTAERFRASGGRVLLGPEDVPGLGRCAVVADPLGAVLVPFRAVGPARTPPRRGPGRFCWETLVTHDPDGAVAYYAEAVGHGTARTPGGEGLLLTAGEAPVADVQPALPGGPAYWATYVAVEDVDVSRDLAARLGGSIVIPRLDVPGLGAVAVVADPEGATLGLFERELRV